MNHMFFKYCTRSEDELWNRESLLKKKGFIPRGKGDSEPRSHISHPPGCVHEREQYVLWSKISQFINYIVGWQWLSVGLRLLCTSIPGYFPGSHQKMFESIMYCVLVIHLRQTCCLQMLQNYTSIRCLHLHWSKNPQFISSVSNLSPQSSPVECVLLSLRLTTT